MLGRLKNQLLDTEIDISMCRIDQTDSALSIQSKIGPFRLLISLLFGLPSLFFLYLIFTITEPVVVIASIIVFPILVSLSVLFGFVIQEKTFDRAAGKAIKSFRLFVISKEISMQLPNSGQLRMFKKWVSTSEGPGCWFYHVEVEGLNGFGFCIGKEKERMDGFSSRLAAFLRYELVQEAQEPAGSQRYNLKIAIVERIKKR